MGAEYYVHFGVQADALQSSQVEDLLADQGGVAETTAEGEAVVVARLNAEAQREGRRADRGLGRRDRSCTSSTPTPASHSRRSLRMSASLGFSEALASVRCGSLESTSSPAGISGSSWSVKLIAVRYSSPRV